MTNIAQDHFQLKKNIPQLRVGDRVRVHQKIQEGKKERIQIFEGLVIKTKNGKGINASFTIRRISLGVGIEKTYPIHLPSITKIEKIRSAKVRRAKLYYVRDLTGKKARRLKGEKKDAKVWEDVITEKKPEASDKKDENENKDENKNNKEKPEEIKENEQDIEKADKSKESK
jgi:large subunit ribosomal protein L19